MSITERLDEIEALANAATEGPWEVRANDHLSVRTAGLSDDISDEIAETIEAPDGAFIADARTTMPALVKALRAVLDVHRQEPASYDQEHPWCEACGRAYPCPTVRTIVEALS